MANKRSKPPIVDTGQALNNLRLMMAIFDAIYGVPRKARHTYQLPGGVSAGDVLRGLKAG